MSTEWFVGVALPVSAADDAPVHATVFISPKLTPDHDGAVLAEFDVFSRWGKVVRDGLRLTLVDQNGPIDTEADASQVDPALWELAFDGQTPVGVNRVPQWQERDWRTFAAKDAADIAKAVHLSTVVSDPVNPVSPLQHPIAEGILGIALETRALRVPRRGDDDLDWPVYDESRLTAVLDDQLPRGPEGAWTSPRPGGISYDDITGDGAVAAASLALRELHRVRRFYERPESQAAEQSVKSPPDRITPVTPPEPEFHERVGAAGDHPAFLRRLGLLIPVRADASRLRSSEWLAVVVSGDVPDELCRSPRLAVRALPDGSLVSVANPADPDIWSDGAMALGDTTVFDVVDVDLDGSAIKSERFLTTLPRLAISQANKTPVDAASPALRASGLTVTRRQQAGRAIQQLERQEGYQEKLDTFATPPDTPLLHTQDVTRGVRVEVWDSETRVWRSLHTRRSTLVVKDETVYSDDLNDGFIQGTSATETSGEAESAVHVHEAMFGWDGWSLSAPRPGRRVRAVVEDAPAGGSRIVETPEAPDTIVAGEKPPHPFVFTHRFAEGTLPRLRYGRDYSFRAWGVDLGGNVRPHHVGPRPEAELAAIRARLAEASPALRNDRAFQRHIAEAVSGDTLGAVGAVVRGLHLGAVDRTESAVALEGSAPVAAEDQQTSGTSAGERLLDLLDVDALRTVAVSTGMARASADALAPRDRRRITLRALGPRGVAALAGAGEDAAAAGRIAAAPLSRTAAVADTFRAALAEKKRPLLRSTIATDLDLAQSLVAAHLAAELDDAAAVTPARAVRALRTLTPLRPFLRWDPVPVPAVVPLTAFTEGESLRVLVVRSGVRQDPVTLEVTTTPPEQYAAEVAAVAPLYAAQARRHLAPPKTSQMQAEVHGVFDEGIDAGTPDARRRMLAWALRESGTFFDQSVPHPTDPSGTPTPQSGVRLLPEPKEGDHFNPSDPARPLKVLPPGSPGTPEDLILRAGDAPAPGQYVVHDTLRLGLPYLPDPLAVGASLTFTQAGAGRAVSFPYASEAVTARYPGTWPDLQPFLLTLAGGPQLDARIDSHRMGIDLPPGDVQRFRLSSCLPKDKLSWLGVWRSLDDRFTADDAVREAAADGLLWALTPGEDITLVHAVPRPVMAPRPTTLTMIRPAGSTLAMFLGGVEVHGPSTDALTATVRWTDTVDDVALPGPTTRSAEASGFTTAVREQESIVPLWAVDQTVGLPGWEGVLLHASVHALPDTRHHVAHYRFRATTRFREYFAPALLAPVPQDASAVFADDGRSVVSAEVEVSVPSTVRPDPPRVHSVLPLFRWGEGEEPEQPFGRRRTRGTGVRIYLERPWFSSGDGELLAVLLSPNGDDSTGFPPQPNPAEGFPFVSQWGSDPIWTAPGVARRAVTLVELDDALSIFGLDDRREPGRPVRPAAPLALPLGSADAGGAGGTADVIAVGYRPQYSPDRRMWYVDIAFDARATFWPFVRFAVARYQPESVAGAHLSTPVQLDFVQLAPERTASVSRTDSTHARVLVAGIAGHRASASRDHPASVAANRRLVGRLQRYDPEVAGDLAWRSVDAVELQVRGRGGRAEELVWVGELEADEEMALRTPRADGLEETPVWRVRVEEWERFPGDPPPRSEIDRFGDDPIWQERLVYADDLYL